MAERLFGFDPEDWGCVTYTDPSQIEKVRAASKPGFLTVGYGTSSSRTPVELRRKILGIYQCSHETGPVDAYLSPLGRQRKLRVQNNDNSWGHAFRMMRAWRVAPETAPLVSTFAHLTYDPAKGRAISRYSRRLKHEEAIKILDMDLLEVPVYGGANNFEPILASGKDLLSPSPAGPVSQSGFFCREAEGPKHLYILTLEGPTGSLFDVPLEGRLVVKVGFSKSPELRCSQFNKAFPECLLRWRVFRSTCADGEDPFSDSVTAKIGEYEMKLSLDREAESRGGEFFLASAELVDRAWQRAKSVAR